MTKQEYIAKGYEFQGNITGKVLWTDGRDGEAVLKDNNGNEYYCESSSSVLFDFMNHKATVVSFDLVKVPGYGLMAFNAKQLYS